VQDEEVYGEERELAKEVVLLAKEEEERKDQIRITMTVNCKISSVTHISFGNKYSR